jgi:PleD family two-component response regulator
LQSEYVTQIAIWFQTKNKRLCVTLNNGDSHEIAQVRYILSGNRILVIDDNTTILRMVEQILVQAGEQVFLAGDGAEGLRQLLAHDPDLIILDIMMPGMDGWMVCAQIRPSAAW